MPEMASRGAASSESDIFWVRLRQRAEALAGSLPGGLAGRARRPLDSRLGIHGRRRTGPGESFWQFRHHQPGDSANAIDWRRSARSDQLYVREREEELAETYWLWCDRSASMHYAGRGAPEAKADRAALIALTLALYLLGAGERVAILGGNRPPVSTKATLDVLRDPLIGPADGTAEIPAVPPAGRIVLISDCHGLDDILTARMRTARGHGIAGHLLHLLDPTEIEFPFAGHMTFEDPESPRQVDIGRADALATAYRREFEAWRYSLDRTARQAGWSYSSHRTDHAPATGLLTVLEMLAFAHP